MENKASVLSDKPKSLLTNNDICSGNCMGIPHPSRHLSRLHTTDTDRQNINLRHDLS